MFRDVLEILIDRMPDHTPAAVEGWRAAGLRGRVYPALVPAPGRRAQGLLMTGVTDAEWQVLDAYEDNLYALRRMELAGGGGGWAYTTAGGDDVLAEDWSREVFAERNLARYVEACRAWVDAYRSRASLA